MTHQETDAVLDAIDEAIVQCEPLKLLTYAYRLDIARHVRRALVPKLPRAQDTNAA